MIVDIIDDLLRPLLQALYTDKEEEKVKYLLDQDLSYFYRPQTKFGAR